MVLKRLKKRLLSNKKIMQARSVYPISISLYPLYCTPPAAPPSSLQVRSCGVWWHDGQRSSLVCWCGIWGGAACRWRSFFGCWWQCAEGGWCHPGWPEASLWVLCHCLQTIQLEADQRASLYLINTMRLTSSTSILCRSGAPSTNVRVSTDVPSYRGNRGRVWRQRVTSQVGMST